MSLELNEVERKVYEILKGSGIKYDVHFNGVGSDGFNGEKWEHDKFIIFFSNEKNSGRFEYNTGFGHRITHKQFSKISPKNIRLASIHKEISGLHRVLFSISEGYTYAVAPTAASVLHSLFLDASAGAETFEDFCSNFGYDTDSRKALDTYLACQENGVKLRKIFNGDLRHQLEKLLQDY